MTKNTPNIPIDEIVDERTKNWFWDYQQIFRSDLSPYARLVRLCLAMHADYSTRQSFPSLKLIAEECGISLSSVKRSLRELEDKGWIRRTQRQLETTNFTSTQYTLLPPPSSDRPGLGLTDPTQHTFGGVGSHRANPGQRDRGRVCETQGLAVTDPGVGSDRPTNKNHLTRIREQDNNNNWVSLESHPGPAEGDLSCCLPGSGQDLTLAGRGVEGSYALSKQERDVTKSLGQNDQSLTPKVLEKETRPALTSSRAEGRENAQALPVREITRSMKETAAAREEDIPSPSGPQVLAQVLEAQLQVSLTTGLQLAREMLASYPLPDVLNKVPIAVAENQVRPIRNLKQFLVTAVEQDWQAPVAVPAGGRGGGKRAPGKEDKYRSLYQLKKGGEH